MSPSGPTFQDELRTIREQRGVAREEIHERTKISLENIARFERGELAQHPHFNEVYLRALVRAYADALGISEEVALQGLERSQSGTYEGELGRVYLGRGEQGRAEEPDEEPGEGTASSGTEEVSNGESSKGEATDERTEEGAFEEEPPDPEEMEETAEDVPLPRVSGSPLDFGEEDEGDRGEQPVEEGEGAGGEGEQDGDEDGSHPLTRDPDEFDQEEESSRSTGETGTERSEEPTAAPVEGTGSKSDPGQEGLVGEAAPIGGSPGGSGASSGTSGGRSGTSSMGRTSSRRGSRSRQRGGFDRYRLPGRLALGAGVLVLLAGLVWVGVLLFSGSSETETESESPAPAAVDTATTGESSEPAGPPLPEIGDSLEVTVVAATGVLEPVRVRRDGGDWNPYWIEEDDSMTFGATDAIELRSYLPRAELLVEGMAWSHSATSLADSVLITREAVQQRIDSMAAARGGPATASPDAPEASPAPNR